MKISKNWLKEYLDLSNVSKNFLFSTSYIIFTKSAERDKSISLSEI